MRFGKRQADKRCCCITKPAVIRDWAGIEVGNCGGLRSSHMTSESSMEWRYLTDDDGETILDRRHGVKQIDGDMAWVDVQRVSAKADARPRRICDQ